MWHARPAGTPCGKVIAMWNDQREIRRYYDFGKILHFDNYYAHDITQHEANGMGEVFKKQLAVSGVINTLVVRNDIGYEKKVFKYISDEQTIDQSYVELNAMPIRELNEYLSIYCANPFVQSIYTSLVKFEIWMKRKNVMPDPKRKVRS